MPPMCVRRQAPVSLAAAPRRELPNGTITMELQARSGRQKSENGVNAIQKWVPFTPKCRPPNSKRERHRRLPVWHAELKMVLTVFRNGFYSHLNAPKSVGGWGSSPDPPIARESAFYACQSDTPRGRGANSHLRPGRQKPSVRHWILTFWIQSYYPAFVYTTPTGAQWHITVF